MSFHPVSYILLWCLLVATAQQLTLWSLLALSVAVIVLALGVAGGKFRQLLKRTRWVIVSLLLIYIFVTPGELMLVDYPVLSPTYEGLQDGCSQLLRLVLALAGLAVLLDLLHRQQLIAGLYSLFYPLQWLGLPRDRLAVRLALTLHYAEVAMLKGGRQDWLRQLSALFEYPEYESREIELPLYRFRYRDGLLLGAVMVVCVGLVV